MTGKFDNPVRNDVHESRNTMMDMWQDSIRRSAQQRTTVTPKDLVGQNEELMRKIRNGEIECPTCAGRQYKDQSNDNNVSFAAPKGINPATATLNVLSHEHEHVKNAHSDAREHEEQPIVNSTVSVEKAVCPLCGKTYIAGGSAKTYVQPDSKIEMLEKKREEFDRILGPLKGFSAKA